MYTRFYTQSPHKTDILTGELETFNIKVDLVKTLLNERLGR